MPKLDPKTGMEVASVPVTSSLHVPVLSATVSVPLSELDSMRAQHAEAIKIAKIFEANQKMIRVDVYGHSTNRVPQRVPNQHGGSYYTDKEVLAEELTSTKLVNLEDILEPLKEEAAKLVDKEHRAAMAGYEKTIELRNQLLTDTNQKLQSVSETLQKKRDLYDAVVRVGDETRKERDILQTENIDLKKKLDISIKAEARTLKEDYEWLKSEYSKLQQQKSFWSWILNKLEGE